MNSIIRKTFYSLPVSLRYSLRRIIYLPEDLLKKRNPLIPPKGMIFIGAGDYLKIGEQFFAYFQKYGNFTPDSSILDIGCGIGRMAIPFTGYLSSKGRYEGFDIVKMGIDWCTKNISSRYPNFNFRLIPLKNDLYRLDTKEKAADLKFPYENDSFDFVFLTSVFTHMLPEDLENYLEEIQRVLKKNQDCFATFFIIDDTEDSSQNTIARKKFLYNFGNYYLMDKNVKEANVAYQKKYIMDTLKKYNFEVSHFIKGNWSGASETELNEHQDIIIIKKL
ncbi:class I SAM-dependent methyltransferase [Flavobacterium enshiense]|uniref:class I SAM-dependent methyltransferase n=1 Tax=Flavobacterium enshiense TaxID=1341165 RepID=UPI00345D5B2C